MSEGARLERGDWPWLASLLLAGCAMLTIFALNAHDLTGGQGGVPLDDAWIHFQFARNLARGDGLSFNPGRPTSGSTAPLWTLLLAAAYLVSGEFPVTGQALSAACFLGTLAATYALAKQLTNDRRAAWLAGAVVAVNGRMVWAGLSALETCLFAALSLAAIGAHLRDRAVRHYRLRTAVLFGLAALSRPEGYFLFALAMADYTWSTLRTTFHESHFTFHVSRFTNHVSRLLRQLPILPLLLFIATILPYLVFSWHTSGHLLPNTYHAKATASLLPDREFRDFLAVGATYLILDNPLLLPFFLFGLILLLGRTPLPSLWCMGLPLAYAVLRVALYQHGRYLMPLIPSNAIVAAWGLLEAQRYTVRRGWWRRLRSPRVAGALAGLLLVAGTAWRLPEMANLYAWNVDNINQMHVALGHWVKENTSPDTVVALNDIGAISYVSERPVIDLAGLVTPEVIPILRSPDREERMIDFMAAQDVQVIIIFPNWFPELAARHDVLEEVHRVTLEHNTIAGGETMVIYRARWQR